MGRSNGHAKHPMRWLLTSYRTGTSIGYIVSNLINIKTKKSPTMKKITLSPAIFIAGFSAANAQSTQTANQTVSLTQVNTLSAATSSFAFATPAIFNVG